jgi:hypothetical protein
MNGASVCIIRYVTSWLRCLKTNGSWSSLSYRTFSQSVGTITHGRFVLRNWNSQANENSTEYTWKANIIRSWICSN